MNVVLFYNQEHQELLPLTFMKPAGELRMGILTFRERWGKLLNAKTSHQSPDYLNELFPIIEKENNVYINPCYFPTAELIDKNVQKLVGEAYQKSEMPFLMKAKSLLFMVIHEILIIANGRFQILKKI